jgi:AraC-like DNA-binding protein
MQLIVPNKDFYEVLEEIKQQYGHTYKINGSETHIQLHAQTAIGYVHIKQIRSGLNIQIDNFSPIEKLTIAGECLASDPLQCNFYLAGNSRGIIQNCFQRSEFDLNAGMSLLMFGGVEAMGFWECLPKSNIHVVEIEIAPGLIQTFFQSNPIALPTELQRILEGDYQHSYWQVGTITPAMQMALHQLLACPFQGAIAQMYLESKAIELVALKLEQIREMFQNSSQQKILKSPDIERIYHAREILLRDIENPPSLIHLAQLVGLNDYKLKLGFRQVFGTTVFGYLRTHRMEQARQLLAKQNSTVSEVARLVGYSSLSRFNTAFKQQFGVSPSACLGKRLK